MMEAWRKAMRHSLRVTNVVMSTLSRYACAHDLPQVVNQQHLASQSVDLLVSSLQWL